MDIRDFVVEYNIVGISMGTIIGFGLTNWVKEFRESIIVPNIIKRFNLTQNYGEITSATIEVIILVILVYLMYRYLITPVIEKSLIKKEIENEKEKEWRENLLSSLNNVSGSNKNILDSINDVNSSNLDINKNIYSLNKKVESNKKKVVGYEYDAGI